MLVLPYLLAMHPGGFRRLSFVRIRLPFTLFMWAGCVYAILKFFPF